MLVAGWRHGLRSEWPFNNNIIITVCLKLQIIHEAARDG